MRIGGAADIADVSASTATTTAIRGICLHDRSSRKRCAHARVCLQSSSERGVGRIVIDPTRIDHRAGPHQQRDDLVVSVGGRAVRADRSSHATPTSAASRGSSPRPRPRACGGREAASRCRRALRGRPNAAPSVRDLLSLTSGGTPLIEQEFGDRQLAIRARRSERGPHLLDGDARLARIVVIETALHDIEPSDACRAFEIQPRASRGEELGRRRAAVGQASPDEQMVVSDTPRADRSRRRGRSASASARFARRRALDGCSSRRGPGWCIRRRTSSASASTSAPAVEQELARWRRRSPASSAGSSRRRWPPRSAAVWRDAREWSAREPDPVDAGSAPRVRRCHRRRWPRPPLRTRRPATPPEPGRRDVPRTSASSRSRGRAR